MCVFGSTLLFGDCDLGGRGSSPDLARVIRFAHFVFQLLGHLPVLLRAHTDVRLVPEHLILQPVGHGGVVDHEALVVAARRPRRSGTCLRS